MVARSVGGLNEVFEKNEYRIFLKGIEGVWVRAYPFYLPLLDFSDSPYAFLKISF